MSVASPPTVTASNGMNKTVLGFPPTRGLLAQPAAPCAAVAVLEFQNPGHVLGFGGLDKGLDGHRPDSKPIANGVITAGAACALVKYSPAHATCFMELAQQLNAVIVRMNPGELNSADQAALDAQLEELEAKGVLVDPSPKTRLRLGGKDVLYKLRNTILGLSDTCRYKDETELSAGLIKSLQRGPRVLKQCRGSAGRGIWLVSLRAPSKQPVGVDSPLKLIEATDGHEENHTLGEFVEFCTRGDAAGKWVTQSPGAYFRGGATMINQRFCPLVNEGEIRFVMCGSKIVQIIHKKPKADSFSAVKCAGAVYTTYAPNERRYADLKRLLDQEAVPMLRSLLELPRLPSIWTVDLVAVEEDDGAKRWVAVELNCSCVGLSALQSFACGAPAAARSAVSTAAIAECVRIASAVGKTVVDGLRARLKAHSVVKTKSEHTNALGETKPRALACYSKTHDVDTIVGKDNIHLGFYPHIADNSSLVILNAAQSAEALTKRMVNLGKIRHNSSVLDLGCGKGLASFQIARLTGAMCTGVDLDPRHIVIANKKAAANPDLRLHFSCDSFTKLPAAVLQRRYSHVISQVALCYAHASLPAILEQIRDVLAPGGVAVLNDYLGSDGVVSADARETVYKRLNFSVLLGHRAWRSAVDACDGLVLLHYENLDKHMEQSYVDRRDRALELGFVAADGSPQADKYSASIRAVRNRDIGMNLAVIARI